ncbi:MAG: dienelactone hydrolase family protein [Pseudohongiellaceae bacterium]
MRPLFTLLLLLALAVSSPLHAKMGTERMLQLQDGGSMKVFVFEGRDGSDGPWPLVVLMPGGSANEYIARAQFWLGYELASRGWAIAVPVSPDSSSFFGRNGERIPEVIDQLQAMPGIRDGQSLLVGVSNGGSSAIEIAARDPERYYGVVAVPGIIRDENTMENRDMGGLPVYIRIGENDLLRWDRRLPDLTRQLTSAGAKVNARLVPDANHVFPLDWEELQPWLDALPVPEMDSAGTGSINPPEK